MAIGAVRYRVAGALSQEGVDGLAGEGAIGVVVQLKTQGRAPCRGVHGRCTPPCHAVLFQSTKGTLQ